MSARPGKPSALVHAVRHRANAALVVLCAAFFASGAAGLMYQVLWVRLLGLVFGVTVYAASVVLATFMAGLALGSLAAERLARRGWHPLRTLAAIEASIGALALLSPALLGMVEAAYVYAAPAAGRSLAALTVLRLISSAVVLLAPTTLMGATLPLIVLGAGRLSRAFERHPAVLYASNTAGAIVGALACGFITIGHLGISRSFLIGAALNAAAAASAFVLSLKRGVEQSVRKPPAGLSLAGRAYSPAWHVPVLFFISGLVSLGLEIAWFRVLTLFVAASTYAFTVMLAVVLAGIALGSAAVAPFITEAPALDVRRLARRFGLLQGFAAVAAVAGFATAGAAYGPIHSAFVQSGYSEMSLRPVAVLATLAILPPMMLFGAAFPVGLQLWIAGAPLDERPARIGRLYAINVVGAIAGSIITGFVLLPIVGTRGSLLVLSALAIAAAFLVLVPRLRAGRPASAAVPAALAIVWILAAASVRDPFLFVLGVRYPGQRLVWKSEGVQTTASVHMSPQGESTLYLDGLHQANDSPRMVAYHRRLAHLPLALHPNPRRALVIGLGGGATAGAAAVHEGVTVDIVELSSTVAAAASHFSHVNYDVRRRPNVHLRVDDARNYLLLTKERYDVITADVIQPRHAGAGNVYSLEYFQLARRVLAEGGMMLQWIGNRAEPEYSLIMRTFLTAFPNATLWASGELMIGTNEPLQLDRRHFERKMQDGRLAAWYVALGTGSFDALLALYTAGPDEMRRYVGPGMLLTDDRPAMEFFRSLPSSEESIDRSGLRGDVRRHLVNGVGLSRELEWRR